MHFRRTETFLAAWAPVADIFPAAESPADWLSPREREALTHIRNPEYHRASAAARILAKCLWLGGEEASPIRAFAADRRHELAGLTILSRDEQGKGVKPILCRDGDFLPAAFSLTHAGEYVAAVVMKQPPAESGASLEGQRTVGCDLVGGTVTAGMIRMFYTPAERQWLENAGAPGLAEKMWAAKEAAYKAEANPGRKPFIALDFEAVPGGDRELSAVKTPLGTLRLSFLQESPMILAVAYF